MDDPTPNQDSVVPFTTGEDIIASLVSHCLICDERGADDVTLTLLSSAPLLAAARELAKRLTLRVEARDRRAMLHGATVARQATQEALQAADQQQAASLLEQIDLKAAVAAAPSPPRLVVLESPYNGATPEIIEENIAYARAAVRHSLLSGEAPLASHLLYTQPGILDDSKPDERAHGIEAGLAWLAAADASVAYTDRGVSSGMRQGAAAAAMAGVPQITRSIPFGPTLASDTRADASGEGNDLRPGARPLRR